MALCYALAHSSREGRDMSDRSVCSLNDEQLEARRALVRAEILPHIGKAERIEGGFAIETDATPEMRQKLEDLVALERRCCSSVDWNLSEVPGASRVRLEVRGLDPDSGLLGSLVDAPRSRSRALLRVAKAGSLGVAVSFFVLCVLPIGLAALGGAALASGLSSLESPLTLALGALLLGTATWALLRWREQRAA
jgi:hypothetical protein